MPIASSTLRKSLASVALGGLGLVFACGGGGGKQAAKPAAAAQPSAARVAHANTLPVEEEAWDPPNPTASAQPAGSAEGEPAEYIALTTRLLRGESGAREIKALQSLSYKNAKSADIAFLLGQLYLEKLWVDDGLKAFRHALQLDPSLRANPFLIRAVITGLGNDGDAAKVRKFLAREIGAPAVPYLREVLFGDWRAQVKERAKQVLDDIP